MKREPVEHKKEVVEDVRVSKEDQIPVPMIVEFTAGRSLINNNEDPLNIMVNNSENGTCNVAVEINKMLYSGAVKHSPTLMLAMKNLDTNKIKLIEVSTVQFNPVVTPPESQNNVLIERKKEADKLKASRAMSKEFVHKFGMLKGQRLYDQAERLAVHADHVRGALESSASKVSVNHNDLSPMKMDLYSDLLPKRNPTATSGMEVYSMDDVIGQEDMFALEELAQQLVETKFSNDQLVQCSPYFISVLKHLIDNCNEHHNQKRLISALLYVEYLLTIAAGRLASENELLKSFPSSIRYKIAREFNGGSSGRRRLSRLEKDKITCYVLVLALLIQNCRVDADLIGASLKIAADKLESLVRVVGAKINRGDDKKTITLTIPLSQPMERGKAKKGRR